jgi:Holliday junction resolvase
MTGTDMERILVNALEDCGWRCMRAPGSGGGTGRDMPDVIAGRERGDQCPELLAIELKTTHSSTCYVTEREDIALQQFSAGFGAEPRLAWQFKQPGRRRRVWMMAPDDCRLTDSGHRALSESSAPARASRVVLPATPNAPAEVTLL